jgi:proteasome lid subunit RPN8/RPN11
MIELSRETYDAVVDHAREGAPEEVCGIFGGDFGDDITHVVSAHRAENTAETPETEYYIDPGEQLELIEVIEDAGRKVAGFYHSHPAGPLYPSDTDASRATWPGLSYLIVVLDGRHPYVGSWRWDDDAQEFQQEAVRLRSSR